MDVHGRIIGLAHGESAAVAERAEEDVAPVRVRAVLGEGQPDLVGPASRRSHTDAEIGHVVPDGDRGVVERLRRRGDTTGDEIRRGNGNRVDRDRDDEVAHARPRLLIHLSGGVGLDDDEGVPGHALRQNEGAG
jgi:hypothetical protein